MFFLAKGESDFGCFFFFQYLEIKVHLCILDCERVFLINICLAYKRVRIISNNTIATDSKQHPTGNQNRRSSLGFYYFDRNCLRSLFCFRVFSV